MDLELSEKVAVVTGGSKGIGLAVVRTLAAEGARVVAGGLTVDALQGIEGVTAVAVDLVEPGGSERLVGETVERHGRIDVLVNHVGSVRGKSPVPCERRRSSEEHATAQAHCDQDGSLASECA